MNFQLIGGVVVEGICNKPYYPWPDGRSGIGETKDVRTVIGPNRPCPYSSVSRGGEQMPPLSASRPAPLSKLIPVPAIAA